MKNKQILEEINRFKLMSNYNPSSTWSEQYDNFIISEAEKKFSDYFIPTLKGDGNMVTGKVNMANVEKSTTGKDAPIAKFKNKGLFPNEKQKLLYLFPISFLAWDTPKLATTEQSEIPTETPDITKKIKPIKLELKLKDPFIINTIKLKPTGEADYLKFKKDYEDKKTKNLEVWPLFLEYLKRLSAKNQLYLRAYASIDEDSNESGIADSDNTSATFYKPCRKPGGMLRKEANQCLSEKRAEHMLSRLEKDIPELKGIFKSIGMGETDKFAPGMKWPDADKNQTQPNRVFKLDDIPPFDYQTFITDNPELNPDKEEEPVAPQLPTKNLFGDSVDLYGPKYVEEDGVKKIYYYGELFDETIGEIKFRIIPGTGTHSGAMDVVGINKSRPEWLYPGPAPFGNRDFSAGKTFVKEYMAVMNFLEGKTNGVWNIDGKEITFFEAADKGYINVLEKSIVDEFGSFDEFVKKVPLNMGIAFNDTQTPEVVLTTKGISVKDGKGLSYDYPGWLSASGTDKIEDVTNVARTQLRYCMRQSREVKGLNLWTIGQCGYIVGY